jgi:hypothetical protein
MTSLRTLLACLCAALALPAHGEFVSFASDTDFLAQAGFTKAFGANVRWGNGATNGDWEYAVVNGADAPFGAPGQAGWTSLPAYPAQVFDFAYGGGTATLTLDGLAPHSGTVGSPAINALAIRARAGAGDAAGVAPFTLNLTSGGSVAFAALAGDADAEYLMLIDPRLAGGFWIDDAGASLKDGSGSLPQWGLKVGVSTVPLPAAAWLFLAGLSLLAGWIRRAVRRPSSAAQIGV